MIQLIKGFRDILPSDVPLWQHIEKTAIELFEAYGFAEMRIPIMEKTELFARSIGETTDIVEKEMYTFADRQAASKKGDTLLTLRPEATASIVRAYIQHKMYAGDPLHKLYMTGPMFRRERPQKGRTRQFQQVGAEVFGAAGPDTDAELLAMCQRVWRRLGLHGLRLEVNSLGTAEERAAFRTELHAYLSVRKDDLDEDSRRRLDRNPMRILDSKNPRMQALLSEAPVLHDFLGPESLAHFAEFRRLLERLDVTYVVNPRLVRGLDYYSHTVFEWITDALGAQGTVCAGGRYDGLVEIQGGKPWPGVGFAMGQERLVELMRQKSEPTVPAPHLYLVMAGAGAVGGGLQLAERLRDEVPGLRIQSNLGGGSFKAQFKRADRSGADLALVLGEDELNAGNASIKHLREQKPQEQVAFADLANWLARWLQGAAGDPQPAADGVQ